MRVASIFKGRTINKKMRLDHALLSSPEIDILKYHEYKAAHSTRIKMQLPKIF